MSPTEIFHDSWHPLLPYLKQEPLTTLNTEILPNIKYYPSKDNIFNVYKLPLKHYNVVILGQDPYFSPNKATGNAFAVPSTENTPPSLRHIKKELMLTHNISFYYDIDKPEWKTLSHWSSQGILLLNTALTVEAGKPGSHLEYWETFIQKTIKYLSYNKGCIWLLWGRKAQKFAKYIKNSFKVSGYDRKTIKEIPADPNLNYILEAPHPAAEGYSGGKAGFYGCNHFYFTNIILEKTNRRKIQY